jgi:protein-L-isoaspartate O-methyltransferase
MTITKLIRPDELHRTRFHTERGDFMPLRSLATVPLSVWDRAWGRLRREPWMNRTAVRFLDALIEPDWSVFEFGSGYSTVWLAERCAAVTSIESDPVWYDTLSADITEQGLDNCTLRLEPLDTFPALLYGSAVFDLVIVDCAEARDERLRCLAAAKTHGRYIVLDDSDRPWYRTADKLLGGWQVRRFTGWKPFPLHAVETSVYRNPAS